VHPQILNGVLEPVVGGDLFGLAHLHVFEVGEDHVAKEGGEGSKWIGHEKILSTNCKKRLITDGGTLGNGMARLCGSVAIELRGDLENSWRDAQPKCLPAVLLVLKTAKANVTDC
jgi:hypothetical protein